MNLLSGSGVVALKRTLEKVLRAGEYYSVLYPTNVSVSNDTSRRRIGGISLRHARASGKFLARLPLYIPPPRRYIGGVAALGTPTL